MFQAHVQNLMNFLFSIYSNLKYPGRGRDQTFNINMQSVSYSILSHPDSLLSHKSLPWTVIGIMVYSLF